MKKLQLIRYLANDFYTLGLFYHGKEFLCYTLERPWLNNKPSESCIPAGEYELRTWVRPNRDHVFIVSGGSVCTTPDLLNPDKGLTRCLILIHAANEVHEIQGCIAPGTTVHKSGEVSNSRYAMSLLHSALKPVFSVNTWMPLVVRGFSGN